MQEERQKDLTLGFDLLPGETPRHFFSLSRQWNLTSSQSFTQTTKNYWTLVLSPLATELDPSPPASTGVLLTSQGAFQFHTKN